MKFIVTTDADGTPLSVTIIDGESGFQVEGALVEVSAVAKNNKMSLSITLQADDVQFVKEAP